MFCTIPHYEESGLGLPYSVVLVNAAQEELDENGVRVGVHIPDMEGLAACVAVARALNPQQLDGREVRFIRRVLGMSGKDFAEALEIDAASLSRWENNKQRLGGWADKQVRMAVVIKLRDRLPGLSLDTKAVVDLHLHTAPDGHWPVMELVRVPCVEPPCDMLQDDEGQSWDMRMAA